MFGPGQMQKPFEDATFALKVEEKLSIFFVNFASFCVGGRAEPSSGHRLWSAHNPAHEMTALDLPFGVLCSDIT